MLQSSGEVLANRLFQLLLSHSEDSVLEITFELLLHENFFLVDFLYEFPKTLVFDLEHEFLGQLFPANFLLLEAHAFKELCVALVRLLNCCEVMLDYLRLSALASGACRT